MVHKLTDYNQDIWRPQLGSLEINTRKSDLMPSGRNSKLIISPEQYNSIKKRLMVGVSSVSPTSSSPGTLSGAKSSSSGEQFTRMEELIGLPILEAQQQCQRFNENIIANSDKESREILAADARKILEKNKAILEKKSIDIVSFDINDNIVAAPMDSNINTPVVAGPTFTLWLGGDSSNEEDEVNLPLSRDVITTQTLSLEKLFSAPTAPEPEKMLSVKPKLKSVQRNKIVQAPQVQTQNPATVNTSVHKLTNSVAKLSFSSGSPLFNLSSREEKPSSKKFVKSNCSNFTFPNSVTALAQARTSSPEDCGRATQFVRDMRDDKGGLKQNKNTQPGKSEQWAWSNGRKGVGSLGSRPKLNIYRGAPKVGMFNNAPRVSGGVGEKLLQKMGWREGDGLGKANEGRTELIPVLEIKTDRKGLGSLEERVKSKCSSKDKMAFVMLDKHPVSALMELSSMRKWKNPKFIYGKCEGGFNCTVEVNGACYTPSNSSRNKKMAKAESARNCLVRMGFWPTQSC